METTQELALIEPVSGMVSGHTVKVQVRLDEDATDQQIMNALDDACRELSQTINTGAALQVIVGRILLAVQSRGIHKREPWGNFNTFVQKEIQVKYGISSRTAYQCVEMVTGLPQLEPKQAKRFAASTLLVAAQAVNHAPAEIKTRVRRRVVKMLERKDLTTRDFRKELKDAQLLRVSHRQRQVNTVRLSFDVSQAVAQRWQAIIGQRAASIVFAEWVEEHGGGRRKQPRRARIGRDMAIGTRHEVAG